MPTKYSAILIAVFFLTVFVLVGHTTSQPNPAPASTEIAAATQEATVEATQIATAEATAASTETALIGDAVRGKTIFDEGLYGSPACKNCHSISTGRVMFAVAPNMHGIAARAATRIPGMSAEQYLQESIRHPEDYIVGSFRPIMYPNFEEDYTDQDIADVVAYLMTL